jgi:hypothetical protein
MACDVPPGCTHEVQRWGVSWLASPAEANATAVRPFTIVAMLIGFLLRGSE